MKAVIMAGGEGTRLRPLSLGAPKPMTLLLGRPVMEHIITLLKSHGITDICVTLYYRPEVIMAYFGDGAELGVSLTYFVEETPLGTAGSVRACMDHLGDDDFLVISGDCVCDLDLTAALEFHQNHSAEATILLYPHKTPLEYGLVLLNEDGKVIRFLEKPSWGQVITNLINTGIYLLTKKAMDRVPMGEQFDFGKDLFPQLLTENAPMFGCISRGYWCDMGDSEAYLQCTSDALGGRVKLDMHLPQQAPGVWSATPIPDQVTIIPPCWIGKGVELTPRCLIGPHVVIDNGAFVGERSLIQRSILLPNSRTMDHTTIYGAIICSGAEVRPRAVLHEGVVLGANSLVERGATLLERVRLWPGRVAPSECCLRHSISTDCIGTPLTFGDGGVIRGRLGEDMSTDLMMTLGGLLAKERQISVGHHGGNGARILAQAVMGGIGSAGGEVIVHELETPAQAVWLGIQREIPVSLFIQQEEERIFVHIIGTNGLPLPRAVQRKLEQGLKLGEVPCVGAENMGSLRTMNGSDVEDYIKDICKRAPLYKIPLHPLVVAVTGTSVADRVLHSTLSTLGYTVITQWREGIPAFTSGHGGFLLGAQEENGSLVDSGQLLAVLTLIEMENGGGCVAVLPNATAAVELVASGFRGKALRIGKDARAEERYGSLPWLRDSAFAVARICSRMSTTGESLSGLLQKIPRLSSCRREIPLHSDRGTVMEGLATKHRSGIDGGEGIRVRARGGYVYLTPLARRSALLVMAECGDMEVGAELCDFFAKQATDIDGQSDGKNNE